jgi:hypothetical protein
MAAPIVQRKTFAMRNSFFQQQTPRGSTPLRETRQRFDGSPSDPMHTMLAEESGGYIWTSVERLWHLNQLPEHPVTTQPVDESRLQKMIL